MAHLLAGSQGPYTVNVLICAGTNFRDFVKIDFFHGTNFHDFVIAKSMPIEPLTGLSLKLKLNQLQHHNISQL